MARDRLRVLSAIIDQGVVPVFHHAEVETCARVVEACVRAGAPCVEFTNRGDFAAQTVLDLARCFSGSEAVLGVGSIVDAPTAALFLANGADFVVSPLLDPDIARLCNRRLAAHVPGCATPGEIGRAHELGCDLVKLFPGAAAGGPDFVRHLLGPMPWAKLMPTGGVEPTEESLRAWFGAGVVACGMGSNLIPKDLLAAGDFAAIEDRVRRAVELARMIRGPQVPGCT